MPCATDLPTPGDTEKMVVNRMEAFWIKALHDAFQNHYDSHPEEGIVVLSKAYLDVQWSRNEFLHDLTVLLRREVLSAYLNDLFL